MTERYLYTIFVQSQEKQKKRPDKSLHKKNLPHKMREAKSPLTFGVIFVHRLDLISINFFSVQDLCNDRNEPAYAADR